MSTILKALRRLEDDRHALENRPLREEVVSANGRAPRSRSGWFLLFLALGGGVAVGAGALAFLSVNSGPAPPAPAAVASARPLEPAPEVIAGVPGPPPALPTAADEVFDVAPPDAGADEPMVAEVAPAAPPRELSTAALVSEVQVVKRPRPAPRIEDAETPPEAVEAFAVGIPSPQSPGQIARAAGREERGRRTPPPAVSEMPPPAPPRAAPEPSPPPVARAEPEPAPPKPVTPPPARAKPAPIVRAVVPEVRVERTRWHPDAARRTAMVELAGGADVREVREGDAVGALVVTTIEPSGVVFAHEGIEVRRRIGE